MQSRKKKIMYTVLVAVLLLAMAAVGSSLAILKKSTERRANSFTFGNVKIELKEPEWEKLTEEEKTVYPGRSVKKDPEIKNTGKNALYAYLEITVPRKEVRTVSEDGTGINTAAWHELFTFTADEGNWICLRETVSDDLTGTTFLYAYRHVLEPGSSTGKLFESVTYINVPEGEIAKGTTLKMPVAAYAIQAEEMNVALSDGDDDATVKAKLLEAFEAFTEQSGK